jgi:hypothetical protein
MILKVTRPKKLSKFLKFFAVLYKFPLVERDLSEPLKPLKSSNIESSEPVDQIVQLTRGIGPVHKPFMILREIPNDNSCLFNSIGYVLENLCLYKAQQLRDSEQNFKIYIK